MKSLLKMLFALFATLPLFAAPHGDYNMPAALAAEAAASDEAMKAMETPVDAAGWTAYTNANPSASGLWLFGSDRSCAVRRDIVPAFWFSKASVDRRAGGFAGTAQPGEFYPFQACVVNGRGEVRDLCWRVESADCPVLPITPTNCSVRAHGVKPLWLGLRIPEDAKDGTVYKGQVLVASGPELAFSVTVKGKPVEADGTHDAWRLSRLEWLDSTAGESDAPTRPFTDVEVNEKARTVSILGRELILNELGLPCQYTSFFNASNTKIVKGGVNFFGGGMRFTVAPSPGLPRNAKTLDAPNASVNAVWTPVSFAWTKKTRAEAAWKAVAEKPDLNLRIAVEGSLGFDGKAAYRILLSAIRGEQKIGSADLSFGRPSNAKYVMGLGLRGQELAPFLAEGRPFAWEWNIARQQDALWLGDVNCGLMIRLKGGNYSRPLCNAYYAFKPLDLPESWGDGGVRLMIANGAEAPFFNAWSGAKTLTEKPLVYAFDLYLTPFKPLDLKKQFSDRAFHYSQHVGADHFEADKAGGANIVIFHHNTFCNPYINYPYNDDGGPSLKEEVGKAHAMGLRLKVYYTTRELTQNLPEFFALDSLDGEIFMPRRANVGWPVTNSRGPHEWLKEHVGGSFIPAWRENVRFPQYSNRLDLAVITTPDTRWNNFFLAGLDYLVKGYGIDGIYIDDTALDRASMMRARRILDADGNTGRRVDMHSWDHFNDLAGYASSSMVFMELYPFYDKIWHGEGFDYNRDPAYWLTEISGIPFGLMGEMLQGGGNPYRGMVYGMTTRWGWSGDPRPLWKFFDSVGLADAAFVGYWDEACPGVRICRRVKDTDGRDRFEKSPDVLASVYRLKDGRMVIALANFTGKEQTVQVSTLRDDRTLAETRWQIPEIPGFQKAAAYHREDDLTVAPCGGCLIIAR